MDHRLGRFRHLVARTCAEPFVSRFPSPASRFVGKRFHPAAPFRLGIYLLHLRPRHPFCRGHLRRHGHLPFPARSPFRFPIRPARGGYRPAPRPRHSPAGRMHPRFPRNLPQPRHARRCRNHARHSLPARPLAAALRPPPARRRRALRGGLPEVTLPSFPCHGTDGADGPFHHGDRRPLHRTPLRPAPPLAPVRPARDVFLHPLLGRAIQRRFPSEAKIRGRVLPPASGNVDVARRPPLPPSHGARRRRDGLARQRHP